MYVFIFLLYGEYKFTIYFGDTLDHGETTVHLSNDVISSSRISNKIRQKTRSHVIKTILCFNCEKTYPSPIFETRFYTINFLTLLILVPNSLFSISIICVHKTLTESKYHSYLLLLKEVHSVWLRFIDIKVRHEYIEK